MDPIRKRGNTLDLSQAKPKGPARAARPVRPAAPKRPYTPEVKAPAPKVAPKPTHSIEVAQALEAARKERAQPQLEMPGTRRRFWPAFAKFIGLLVVLGLIVAGGLYIYLNFYTQQ